MRTSAVSDGMMSRAGRKLKHSDFYNRTHDSTFPIISYCHSFESMQTPNLILLLVKIRLRMDFHCQVIFTHNFIGVNSVKAL